MVFWFFFSSGDTQWDLKLLSFLGWCVSFWRPRKEYNMSSHFFGDNSKVSFLERLCRIKRAGLRKGSREAVCIARAGEKSKGLPTQVKNSPGC